MPKNRKLNTLSLFAGGGGLDIGFASAGYSILAAIDNDPFSCETLELNKDKTTLFQNSLGINDDIGNITINRLSKEFGIKKDDINVLIGGPPCQAFSVFGRRRGLDDPRGNLIWEYIRLVKEIDPEIFVLENVVGIKTIHDGDLYSNLLKELSCEGKYIISDHTYNVAEYGIPQHRERVFFIGAKTKKVAEMPPTHGNDNGLFPLKPFVTVGQVLKDLGEPHEGNGIPNHKGRKHSQRIIDRYKSLKFGERDHKTRINKLDPCRPSFTIIVGSDAGGGKGHIHPYSPREVTPRESARMQTFPDWWEFSGNGRHVIRQVGNAVPPLFAALLAEHIKAKIWSYKKLNTYNDIIEKLGLDYLKNGSPNN
jgi:DNA (cytosine-5)-methyltransferase 1